MAYSSSLIVYTPTAEIFDNFKYFIKRKTELFKNDYITIPPKNLDKYEKLKHTAHFEEIKINLLKEKSFFYRLKKAEREKKAKAVAIFLHQFINFLIDFFKNPHCYKADKMQILFYYAAHNEGNELDWYIDKIKDRYSFSFLFNSTNNKEYEDVYKTKIDLFVDFEKDEKNKEIVADVEINAVYMKDEYAVRILAERWDKFTYSIFDYKNSKTFKINQAIKKVFSFTKEKDFFNSMLVYPIGHILADIESKI